MRIDRVLAPNPGPYTGPGTNTYVVEDAGQALVLDPGPVIDTHLVAIEHALGDANPVAVLVTHTHPDHAPAANPLAARLGVPALGFAPGPSFVPSDTLAHGDLVDVGAHALEVVHTPGHTDDHVCYLAGDVLFTGDHIMGGSTVIIEDAAAYMASLQRVLVLDPQHLYPGHGDEIPEAAHMIEAYIAHRVQREAEVLMAIQGGASTVREIVEVVYADLDDSLLAAATMQVNTQLKKLYAEGRVDSADGGDRGISVVLLPGSKE